MVLVVPVVVAIWMRSRFPLYIPLLIAFGLEDTAFYSLQLKAPAYYVGISILGIWEPRRDLALTLNLLGVGGVAVIELFHSHVSEFLAHISNLAKPNSQSRKDKPL